MAAKHLIVSSFTTHNETSALFPSLSCRLNCIIITIYVRRITFFLVAFASVWCAFANRKSRKFEIFLFFAHHLALIIFNYHPFDLIKRFGQQRCKAIGLWNVITFNQRSVRLGDLLCHIICTDTILTTDRNTHTDRRHNKFTEHKKSKIESEINESRARSIVHRHSHTFLLFWLWIERSMKVNKLNGLPLLCLIGGFILLIECQVTCEYFYFIVSFILIWLRANRKLETAICEFVE